MTTETETETETEIADKIAEITPAVTTAAVAPAPVSEAERIWDQIKNVDLRMFGMSGQTVAKQCEKLPLAGNTLYLKAKVSAVIAALDTALNTRGDGIVEKRIELFNIEQTENGLIAISRKIMS